MIVQPRGSRRRDRLAENTTRLRVKPGGGDRPPARRLVAARRSIIETAKLNDVDKAEMLRRIAIKNLDVFIPPSEASPGLRMASKHGPGARTRRPSTISACPADDATRRLSRSVSKAARRAVLYVSRPCDSSTISTRPLEGQAPGATNLSLSGWQRAPSSPLRHRLCRLLLSVRFAVFQDPRIDSQNTSIEAVVAI